MAHRILRPKVQPTGETLIGTAAGRETAEMSVG